MMTCVYSQKIL